MLIDKKDIPLVSEDSMNDVHFEDIDIINELYEQLLKYENDSNAKNKQIIIEKYNNWIDHTISHFDGEEERMIELKFPPYLMHKSEHDRCLDEMKQVLIDFEENSNVMELKKYFEEDLIQWLIVHIETMDTVTAMFFSTGLSPCQMN